MLFSREEFEQGEQLRLFWKKHGKTILTAILFIFLGALSWQLWQRYQTSQARQASVFYDQLVSLTASQQTKEAKEVANTITKSFRFTIYATLSKLWLAEQAISEQKYSDAINYLNSAKKSENDKKLKQIIALRLARIYIQQKLYTDALIVLDKPLDKAFAYAVFELKGDVYRLKNDLPRSKKAYQEALDSFNQQAAPEKIRIEMKLNSLGII